MSKCSTSKQCSISKSSTKNECSTKSECSTKNINSRKCAFFLDATYTVKNNQSYIVLSCLGRSKFKMYYPFDPYFYVLPRDDGPKALKEDLLELTDAGRSVVKQIDNVEKTLNGEKLKLLKVVCTNPSYVPKLKKLLDDYQCFEYKIPYAHRFMIDHGLRPTSFFLYDREGKYLKKIIKVKDKELAKLNVMCFDIEVASEKMPSDLAEDPIIMISLSKNGRNKVLTYKSIDDKKAVVLGSEEEMLTRFFEEIQKADVLVGYNSSAFDIPYIITRCKRLNVSPVFYGSVPDIKRFGRYVQAPVRGVIHIDLYPLIQFYQRLGAVSVTRFTLNQVYKDIFDVKDTTKSIMKNKSFVDMWEDKKLRQELFKYSLGDAKMTYEIFMHIYGLLVELSRLSGCTMFDISQGSSSKLIERLLSYHTFERNEVVPPLPRGSAVSERFTKPIEGAYVKIPNPGIYKDIIVFDFMSLYPSIIVSHNIDPSTLNKKCKDYYESPNGHKFCKDNQAIIPTVLEELIRKRAKIKKQLKKNKEMKTKDDKESKTQPNDEKQMENVNNVLSARSQALKILANSFYGYLGYPRSRWYSRECAESVTAWGRHYIKQTIQNAEDDGFKVLYSDTDSIFLLMGDKTLTDSKQFLKRVNDALPGMMELDYEDFYPRGIFVSKRASSSGAKKKYAMINKEGKIKIKGFALVRRDWSPIARETQKKVLEIILMDGDEKKAVKKVQTVINDLRDGKIPIEKTAIRTVIRKNLDSYDLLSPEVSAAIKAVQRGQSIGAGSMVDYVITKGGTSVKTTGKRKSKISDTAELLEYAKDYDPDYYIENQILPSVLKILGELGVSKDELLGKGKQSSLDHFF